MPLIILLSAAGGAYAYNKFDDAYVDPFFGNTQDSIFSGKNIALATIIVVGVMYAKKKRYI